MESSLLVLNLLVQTLYHLDKGLKCKHAFDLLIAHFYKIKRIKESLCVVQTMMGNSRLNIVTFHPIVNVLTKKKTKEAWLVANLMKVTKVSLDVTTYNSPITNLI
ncbi:hypothetical protein GOBAR_DD04204 [Gossypium barbadense]|nr:hypothetical protein GOBAR_DD04204 [Gossypium barbadense]